MSYSAANRHVGRNPFSSSGAHLGRVGVEPRRLAGLVALHCRSGLHLCFALGDSGLQVLAAQAAVKIRTCISHGSRGCSNSILNPVPDGCGFPCNGVPLVEAASFGCINFKVVHMLECRSLLALDSFLTMTITIFL